MSNECQMPSSVASKYIIQHLHLHQCHVGISIFIYVTISPRMYVHISTVVRFNKSQDIIGRSRETQSQHNLLLIYDRWPRSAHYPTGASKSKYKQKHIWKWKQKSNDTNKTFPATQQHWWSSASWETYLVWPLQSECSPRPKQTEKAKVIKNASAPTETAEQCFLEAWGQHIQSYGQLEHLRTN